MGRSSWLTIWGNKFFPTVGDYYLARNAIGGQQSQQDISPDRRANLFESVPGDQAAHGIFDDQAESTSWQAWLSRHRGSLLAGSAAAVGLAAGLMLTSNGE